MNHLNKVGKKGEQGWELKKKEKVTAMEERISLGLVMNVC